MKILVHTDHTITGDERRTAKISGIIEGALSRFSDHITRVEVHVSDENSRKAGAEDIRCVLEARLSGRQPVAVTQHSDTIDQAVEFGAGKLARLIQHTMDRLSERSGGRP